MIYRRLAWLVSKNSYVLSYICLLLLSVAAEEGCCDADEDRNASDCWRVILANSTTSWSSVCKDRSRSSPPSFTRIITYFSAGKESKQKHSSFISRLLKQLLCWQFGNKRKKTYGRHGWDWQEPKLPRVGTRWCVLHAAVSKLVQKICIYESRHREIG